MNNIEELRESAAERIFLVPVSEDGDLYYCWCDDPAPSVGMEESEAVEYVRADVVQTLRGQLEESERWGNEMTAVAARAVAAAKDLSDASNESEADDATEIIESLTDIKVLNDAMTSLRAKHWHEAIDWVYQEGMQEDLHIAALHHIDAIERGGS